MRHGLARRIVLVTEALFERSVPVVLWVAGQAHLHSGLRRRVAEFARRVPDKRLRLREEVAPERLMALAESQEGRELLRGRWSRDLADLITLIDSDPLAALARRILSQADRSPAAVSSVLFQTVVLDRLTAPLAAQRACLLAITATAQRLERSHQRSLLRRCIAILSQPFNPYEGNQMTTAARWAAASLLIAESSLDIEVLAEIREGNENEQALLDVIGGAIRARDTDRPGSVASVLDAADLNAEGAQLFCELCDTGFSSLEPVLGEHSVSEESRLASLWSACRQGLPFLAGFLLAGVILGAREVVKVPDGLYVDAGVALGALALLVATHVVSAQLSAERLPGSLARFSSQPWSVEAGYSAGLVMVASALLAQTFRYNDLWRQTATACLLLFTTCLIVMLITLVRRTDSTTAVIGFARDQRDRFRASGAKMGSIQATAQAGEERLNSLPWARYGGSEPLSERREPIRATANGFTAVKSAALKRLSERSLWQERELTLHVGGGLGTLVHRGKEIAAITPGRSIALPREELKLAKDAFQVQSETSVEECAESLAALAGLSGDLALHGNPGGSNRVCDALIDLLSTHLRACHQVRGEESGDSARVYPVNLALQSVLTAAVERIGRAENAQERRAMALLVRRVLSITIAGDGAISMAITALPRPGTRDLYDEELEVLWWAGARALELGHSPQMVLLEGQLERRMEAAAETSFTTPMEIAARLTMLNVWTDQLSAGSKWKWFWKHSAAAKQPYERELSAIRIGAAALLAGCASVALEVTIELKETELATWRTYIEHRGFASAEEFLSAQYGLLLGLNPAGAMVSFLDFTQRVAPLVP